MDNILENKTNLSSQEKHQSLVKRKGTNSFSDVMRANEVNYLMYDVTAGNVKHTSRTFSQNTLAFILYGISENSL